MSRILLLDIENTPHVATTWSMFPRSPLSYENLRRASHLISVAWKYLGERRVYSADLVADRAAKGQPVDAGILRKLAPVLALADVVIAHNGDKHDMPKIRGRMAVCKMQPLPPVPTIDTLKIVRRVFDFPNRSLDGVAGELGLRRKLKTDFAWWLQAMDGDATAIRKIAHYNREDVRVLEAVFNELRPWVPPRVNLALMSRSDRLCPTCGEDSLQQRGRQRSRVRESLRFQCDSCGAWCSKPLLGGLPR